MKTFHATVLAGALFVYGASAANACPKPITPAYALPQVAPGWSASIFANGFKKPRQLKFDSEGHLLVLDAGVGVRRLTIKDDGDACLEVTDNQLLINRTTLTHGMALSADGKTLYASSVKSVFAWNYDPKAGTVNSDPSIVVDNMANNDHVTRTLVMSKKNPGFLIVSRGSDENHDLDSLDINNGLSQIRVFDLNRLPSGRPYNFNSEGRVLGWGLRNSVGVAEDPSSGNVYSVENSIDDITRNGVDIHQNNPGEELNFHGRVSDTNQGGNYGYPTCFALWDGNIPNGTNLRIGQQFSNNDTISDQQCAEQFVAPRLTLPAHTAPLDLIFSPDASTLYIAFHGSFNRDEPTGYTVSSLAWANGAPTAQSSSTSALTDIISNPNIKDCPGKCFRPVGLEWDSKGRLLVTGDTSGELYILAKQSGTPTSTASGTIITATGSPNAANVMWNAQTLAMSWGAVLVAALLSF